MANEGALTLKAAEAALAKDDLSTAMSKAQDAVKMFKGQDNLRMGAALITIAKVKMLQSGSPDLKQTAKDAVAIASKSGSTGGEVANYLNDADLMAKQEGVDNTLQVCQDALLDAQQAAVPLLEVKALFAIAQVYAIKENGDALKAVREALAPFREAGVCYSYAPLVCLSGTASDGRVRRAMDSLDKAKSSGDVDGQAAALFTLINYYQQKKQIEDVTSSSKELEEILSKAGKKEAAGVAAILVSEACMEKLHWVDILTASNMTSQALSTFTEMNHLKGKLLALNILVEISLNKNALVDEDRFSRMEFKNGSKLAKDAFEIAEKMGDRKAWVQTLATFFNVCLSYGELDEAQKLGMKTLDDAKADGNRYYEAAALDLLANLCIVQGDYGEAKRYATDSLEVFRELGEPVFENTALQALLDAHTLEAGPEEVMRTVAEEQLQYFKAANDKKGEASLLKALSDKFFFSSDKSEGHEAQNMGLEALALYKSIGDKKAAAKVLDVMAAACLSRDGAAGASDAMEKASEGAKLRKELKDKWGEGQALLLLIDASLKADMIDDALETAQQAATLFPDNKMGKAAALVKIASIYGLKKDRDKAIEAAKEAEALFTALNDKEGIGQAIMAQVDVIFKDETGRSSAAEEVLPQTTKALSLFKAAKAKAGQTEALMKISQIHAALGDGPSAMKAAMQVQELAKATGDQGAEGRAWNVIARAHVNSKDMDGAMVAARKARTLCKDSGDLAGEKMALSTINLVQGQMAEAGSKSGKAGAKGGSLSKYNLAVCPVGDPARTKGKHAVKAMPGQCIIYGSALMEKSYMHTLLEVFSLVADIVQSSGGGVGLVVMTQGCAARNAAYNVGSQAKNTVTGGALWAACRSIRLEAPRMHIFAVDLAPHFTGNEIAKCVSVAQRDSSFYPMSQNKLKSITES